MFYNVIQLLISHTSNTFFESLFLNDVDTQGNIIVLSLIQLKVNDNFLKFLKLNNGLYQIYFYYV